MTTTAASRQAYGMLLRDIASSRRAQASKPKPAPKQKSNPPKKQKKQNGAQPPKKGKLQQSNGGKKTHAMSPYSGVLIPALIPSGQAIAYRGTFTSPFKQQTNQTVLIVVSNYGDNAGAIFYLTKTVVAGVATVAGYVDNFPAVAITETAGGPQAGRAMKSGVSIVSNTPNLNRGGGVFFINTASKLTSMSGVLQSPSTMTGTQYDAIFNAVILTDGMQPMDATMFGTTKHFAASIADSNDYHAFRPWTGAATVDSTWARFQHDAIPMTYQIFAFSVPVNEQSYTISVRNTYYLRYPLGSMQAGLHKDIPVASGPIVNAIHSIGSAIGSAAHGVYNFAAHEAAVFTGTAAQAYTAGGQLALG